MKKNISPVVLGFITELGQIKPKEKQKKLRVVKRHKSRSPSKEKKKRAKEAVFGFVSKSQSGK